MTVARFAAGLTLTLSALLALALHAFHLITL